MEDGSFRADVSVSVHVTGQQWCAWCEIINLNSIKSTSRAIEFERDRQRSLLSRGMRVLPDARLYNAVTGQTVKMQGKDSQLDYQLMPDADIPDLHHGMYSLIIARTLIFIWHFELLLQRYRINLQTGKK